MISDLGISTHLLTHATKRYAYDTELDDQGRHDHLSIDYGALAAMAVTG